MEVALHYASASDASLVWGCLPSRPSAAPSGAPGMSPASQRATSANSDAPSTARAVGQMKGSEARIDMRVAIVYTVRDGLIVRGQEFASREEALEAAGLSD